MLANSKKNLLDNEVAVDFYEHLASLETDEKEKASWLVQADKSKIQRPALEDAVVSLEKFISQY